MSSTVLSYSARSQNGRGGGAVHSRVIDRELHGVGGFALYIDVHVKYACRFIPGFPPPPPPLFSRAHPKTKAISSKLIRFLMSGYLLCLCNVQTVLNLWKNGMVHISNAHVMCVSGGVWVCAWMRTVSSITSIPSFMFSSLQCILYSWFSFSFYG